MAILGLGNTLGTNSCSEMELARGILIGLPIATLLWLLLIWAGYALLS